VKVNFNIKLDPLDAKDIETIRHWRNDYQIMRHCRQSDFISDAEQERWFARQEADPSIKMYCIKTVIDGAEKLIGVAGLTSLDFVSRRAEFSLYIAPQFQRRGYGRCALILLFSHGFQNLNLEQIWGECFDGNPALKVFDGLGMKRDGVRRNFYFKDGRYLDAVLVSVLAAEWRSFLGNGCVLPVDAHRADSEQRLDSTSNSIDHNGAPPPAGRQRGNGATPTGDLAKENFSACPPQ
jgi:RimJ/RimL family protein N-acetyltransferase